jgi:hypothetical protein
MRHRFWRTLSALGIGPMLFAVLSSPACAPKGVGAAAERAAVEKVIVDSISWALTKDRALQESTMAKDENLFYFWTDSDAGVRGWDAHVKLFDLWMGPRFKATRTEVRDLHITFSRAGDVAWYWCYLDDLGEWDGQPVGEENIRWTGVLERRDGKWLIVQMHASLAAERVREEALKSGKK